MTYNTGETSEELKQKYNPEGSVLRCAQYRMLEMLDFLKDLCEKLEIEWCLEGGNVLGAVRHGGFIPWDDDVDVIMKRSDYERLISYMKKNPHNQFVIQDHETDFGYCGSWAVIRDLKSEYLKKSSDPIHEARKYRGLQIDIFPIEIGFLHIVHKIAAKIQSFNHIHFIGRKPKIAHYYYLISYKCIFPVLRLIERMFGDKKFFTYELGHTHYPKFYMDAVFPIGKTIFEGKEYPAPCNPDMYLRCLYKDYTKLPPIDKRDQHHVTYRIWS